MVAMPAPLQAFIDAAANPEPDRLARLEAALTEDVVVAGVVGTGEGREAVLAALANPNAPRMLGAATWSEPAEEDGEVVVDGRLPAGMPIGGLRLAARLAPDGRISRVEQGLLMADPPAAVPVAIPDEMKAMIDGALANGTPFVVSYVDAAGVPHISPRGSVQVLNATQVGIWARDPEGGLPKGVVANPNVALFYRDPKTRAGITITGKARIADAATRETIYANQPQLERNFDGRKRGVGIVVDVELLEAAGPAGRTRMVKA